MSIWGYLFPGSDDDEELRRARGMALLQFGAAMYDPRTGQASLSRLGQALEPIADYRSAAAKYAEGKRKLAEQQAEAERMNAIRARLAEKRLGAQDPEMLAAMPDERMPELWRQAEDDRRKKLDQMVQLEREKGLAREKRGVELTEGTNELSGLMAQIPEEFRAGLAAADPGTLKQVAARFQKQQVNDHFNPPKPPKGNGEPAVPKAVAKGAAQLQGIDSPAVWLKFQDAYATRSKGATSTGPHFVNGELVQGGPQVQGDAVFQAAVDATKGITDPTVKGAIRNALMETVKLAGGVNPTAAQAFSGAKFGANPEGQLNSIVEQMRAKDPATRDTPELRLAILALIRQGGDELDEFMALYR